MCGDLGARAPSSLPSLLPSFLYNGNHSERPLRYQSHRDDNPLQPQPPLPLPLSPLRSKKRSTPTSHIPLALPFPSLTLLWSLPNHRNLRSSLFNLGFGLWRTTRSAPPIPSLPSLVSFAPCLALPSFLQ
jgi:hypothetical protein